MRLHACEPGHCVRLRNKKNMVVVPSASQLHKSGIISLPLSATALLPSFNPDFKACLFTQYLTHSCSVQFSAMFVSVRMRVCVCGGGGGAMRRVCVCVRACVGRGGGYELPSWVTK